MKKLFILFIFSLCATIAGAQTIGIQKEVTLSDGSTGNFLTIQDQNSESHIRVIPVMKITGADTTYVNTRMDSILYKVDFVLYKTKLDYLNDKAPMYFRYEVQFLKSKTFNVIDFYEFLYDNSMSIDSFLMDGIKINL